MNNSQKIVIIVVLTLVIGFVYYNTQSSECNPSEKEIQEMLKASREMQTGAGITPVDVKDETVKIVICFGQSNMVGRATFTEFRPRFRSEDPRRLRLEDDGWYMQKPSIERNNGPEISLLYYLSERYPDDIFGVIKVGIGATGIRAFSPEWNYCEADILNDGEKGPLYRLLKEKIELAYETCNPDFIGVVMKQGGNDMNLEEAASGYINEVEEVITELRKDTQGDTPFLVCTYFSDDQLEEWGPEGLTETPRLPLEARKAFGDRPYSYSVLHQLATADTHIDNTYLVIHDWLPVLPDGLHFTTQSQEILGRQIFETLVQASEHFLSGDSLGENVIQVIDHTLEPATRGAPPVSPPSEVTQELVYYTDAEEHQHSIQLCYPEEEWEDKLPVIVYFHGGGYISGTNTGRDNQYFARRGYYTANVNYSLSMESKFPAQIEEATAAITWLKENHLELGIDPERIGVWGTSAGGHLAALLGVTSDVSEFETMVDSDYSSKVQAVIDLYGAVNFTSMGAKDKEYDGTIEGSSRVTFLVDGPLEEKPELVELANPLNHITQDDPPYFIIHGDRDKLIPHNQSQILYLGLKAEGLDATLLTVHNAGHGFKPTLNYPSQAVQTGQNWAPKTSTILKAMEVFFDKHLRDIEPQNIQQSVITVKNTGEEIIELKLTHQIYGNRVNSTQSDIITLQPNETYISRKDFINMFGVDPQINYIINII